MHSFCIAAVADDDVDGDDYDVDDEDVEDGGGGLALPTRQPLPKPTFRVNLEIPSAKYSKVILPS